MCVSKGVYFCNFKHFYPFFLFFYHKNTKDTKEHKEFKFSFFSFISKLKLGIDLACRQRLKSKKTKRFFSFVFFVPLWLNLSFMGG